MPKQDNPGAPIRYLMCPPQYFDVEYVINPWMNGQIHATEVDVAQAQWTALRDRLQAMGTVETMPAILHLPDLVFTANAALVYDGKAVLSRFRFAERQPEAAHYASWLRQAGFVVFETPFDVHFEGAGDALIDRAQPLVWMGHGMRSDLRAGETLKTVLGLEVEPLRLCDPRFYHLDTCFCPLEGGYLLYFPAAFDDQGREAIEVRVPADLRIAVEEEDATRFACNAVNLGREVVVNNVSAGLQSRLEQAGFQVACTPLTEFMRAGGAAKCLSLRLDES